MVCKRVAGAPTAFIGLSAGEETVWNKRYAMPSLKVGHRKRMFHNPMPVWRATPA